MRRSSPLDERPTYLATFFHQDFISRAVAKEIIRVGPLPMRVRVILVDFLIITAFLVSMKRRPIKGRCVALSSPQIGEMTVELDHDILFGQAVCRQAFEQPGAIGRCMKE